MGGSYLLLILLLFAAPLYAQVDHADLARAAFDASALPPPPRSVEAALSYVARLLSMLPAGERAGYVKGPQGGENVATLADGTLVRVSRVIYPNGQIYKVMGDAPNGGPQWVAEDVRPDLYLAFGGLPPPVVTPPPTPPPNPSPLPPIFDTADIVQRLMRLENQHLQAELREQQLLSTTTDTNVKVTELRQTWGEIGMFVVKYVVPAVSAAWATYHITKE